MKKLKTYENFSNGPYPFEKIKEIFIWFNKKHAKEINKEGWLIAEKYFYTTKNWGKTSIFIIEKIDVPTNDEARLNSDSDAARLASRWGFIYDDQYIIYDFNYTIYNKRDEFKSAFYLNLL